MTSDTPLLEATNLGRRHPNGKGWLFQDISVRVAAGQRIALSGPSGSGKTLLLRALAMLDRVDTGEIRCHGATIEGSAIPEYRSRAIYLHQRTDLIEATVERFLRQPYQLKIHRDSTFDRERVIRFLESVGRGESFLEKLGRDLSGGEGQIVTLIRALQLDPQLLLLDEPTAALDAHTAEEVEQLASRWVREDDRRAFIWVSHDTRQSQRVADDLWQIRGGRLA